MITSNASLDEARRQEALRQNRILDTLPVEALRASELRYRRLFESAKDGILILDAETGMVVDVNPFLTALLGFSHAQFMGKAIWELGFFKDVVANEEKFAELRAKEYVRYEDLPLESSDGRKIDVEFVSNVYLVNGSKVIQCNVRDITERKKAEKALQFSEARFASIFQSSPAAIGIHTVATERVIEVNERLCEFSGWTREELIGKTVDELGTWVDPAQRNSVMEQVASAGSAHDVEVQLRRRTGEVRDVLLSIERMEMPGESEPVVVTIFTDLTERKRAKAQLKLLETCVARLNDIVFITEAEPLDEPGPRILFVNDAFVRLTGYTREETLGRSPRFLQGTKTSRAELHRIGAALRQGKPVRGELINYKKSGEEYWIELDIMPIADAADRITNFVAIMRDISERKQAEYAMRKSEERFSHAFEYAPIGMALVSLDGHWLKVNRALCGLVGYSEAELLTRTFQDITHPEDLERDLENLHRMLAGEVRYYDMEKRYIHASGHLVTVLLNVSLVRDDQGQPSYFVSQIQDITKRKCNEARFRRLIDSNAQGVHFRRTNGAITGANDAFLQLVGYTHQDVEAGRMNWIDMTPPEYAALDQRCIEELATKGVCAAYEKEYQRQDGSRVPVLVGVAAFADDPDEGVCFVLDLTERKKLEQQFLRAQRMESIGTLAGGIAHDLNNTLGPIIMSIDLLQTKFTDPDSQELLAIISSSAQRGADMVRQVLSFARGVEGRRMEVQIRHLLRDVEKIVKDTFSKNIQVRTILPYDLWTVLGDPTQIHQVLLNLCVNARDAMPNGGALTLTAENLTLDAHYAGLSWNPDVKPGPYVSIQVTDNGSGIPREVIEKIFDPFFTTKELGKGTGLGLSTSLAIVKSHGGFIRVYSELGRGTKFKVYLPAQTESSPSAAEELAAEMPRGHGELILVVDDEAAVRQITQQTLEAFGYRVVVAADGAEAVAIFARQGAEIAVVLTDMMMPIMDGPATIQVLRRMNPAVRIIGASGLSANGHVAHAASLGVKHFLPKPYTAETLLKTLKQVLSAEP